MYGVRYEIGRYTRKHTQKEIRFDKHFKPFIKSLGYGIIDVVDIADVPTGIDLFFASGFGYRKYEDGSPILHFVVWDKNGLFHDPHPSKSGLKEVKYFSYLIKESDGE